MKDSAVLSIDHSGRLVVPREICEAAGFQPGMATEVSCRGGRIEIEPAPREVRIVKKGRLRIAVPVEPSPKLSSDTVRRAQESLRSRRLVD